MTLRFASHTRGEILAFAGDKQVGLIIRGTGQRRASARYGGFEGDGSRWQEFRPSSRDGWPPPNDTLVDSAKAWLQEQHDKRKVSQP